MENKSVGDKTYIDLPTIGETGKESMLAQLGINLRTESSYVRANFIGTNFDQLDKSQNLYLYGREDWKPNDTRPTVNLIQACINTFVALATRTDPAIELKSASVNSEGVWILTKPFTIHGSQLGEGEQLPDHELTLYEPIPEEVLEWVPPTRRLCINTETVVEWMQANFDIVRRKSRMDNSIRKIVFLSALNGWPTGLFQWDTHTELPKFLLYPPHQWFPDPLHDEVSEMSYMGLDMVVDCNEAKRFFPEAADMIDKWGSRTIQYQTGSVGGYSSIYTNMTYQRPVVTLSFTWLRNQPAPMTLDEGLQTGFLMVDETAESPATTQDSTQETTQERAPGGNRETEPPEGQSESVDVDADGDSVDQYSSDESVSTPAKPARKIIHAHTKDDLTSSFDNDGNPNAGWKPEGAGDDHTPSLHPNHPHKLVNREWIQIMNEVIPGTDRVCPYWDFPVFMGKNIHIPHRPFSQPETERLASLQRSVNANHESMVQHAAFFKGNTGLIDKDLLTNADPDLVNGFMRPGKVYAVDLSGVESIQSKYFHIQPPPMPPALPQMDTNLMNKFDIVSGNRGGVLQGGVPAGVESGTAIERLQSEAQSPVGLKGQYIEETVARMAMLTLDAMIKWQSVETYMERNRKYPRVIVERYLLPYAKQIEWDLDVSVPIGQGQVRAMRDNQLRADFAMASPDGTPLIDAQTARERLDYDHEEIDRRQKAKRQALAEEQLENAQRMAPKEQPQEIKTSVSMAWKDIQADVQNQLLGRMGMQPSTEPSPAVVQAAATPDKAPPGSGV